MRLTRQQGTLLVLLGVGVVALLVDKMFLSPASAGASPGSGGAEPQVASREGAPAAPQAPSPLSISMATVRARLSSALGDSAWDSDAIRKSLRPTPSWALFAEPREETASPSGRSIADQFRRTYQLTSVMNQGGTWVAIISGGALRGGQVLRVGSVVEGFSVVAIDDRCVRFQAGTQVVELTLPAPRVGERSGPP